MIHLLPFHLNNKKKKSNKLKGSLEVSSSSGHLPTLRSMHQIKKIIIINRTIAILLLYI